MPYKVNEVCELTGVTRETLYHYENIDLLVPSRSETEYRFYDDDLINRLKQIQLFKEMGFKLSDIKEILDNPEYDRSSALEQRIKVLTEKKEHLENLILFAKRMKFAGTRMLNIDSFISKNIDEIEDHLQKNVAFPVFEDKFNAMVETFAKNVERSEKFFLYISELVDLLRENEFHSVIVQEQVKRVLDYSNEDLFSWTEEDIYSLCFLLLNDGSIPHILNTLLGGKMSENIAYAFGAYMMKNENIE